MKKTVALILALLLCLLCAGAYADVTFDPQEVVDNFHGDVGVLFEAMDPEGKLYASLSVICRVSKVDGVEEKYGFSAYKNEDGHLIIIADRFIFSYVDKPNSVLINIPQMPLGLSMRYVNFDDGFAILEWMNDSDDQDIYVGNELDVHHYNTVEGYSVYLFVNHGQQLEELPWSVEELMGISLEILR